MVPPSIRGLTGGASFAENTVNATPQRLDTDVTFAWGSLVGGTLTIAGLLAEDRVSIQNLGTGAGQIGFNGISVTYAGTTIGTATGGIGTTFTVTLNAAASSAAVEALVENLTYADVSNAPTATRVLTLDLVDTGGQRALVSNSPIASFAPTSFGAMDVGYFSTPSFVDWDGDGDLDFVVGNSDGVLAAWKNTGSATQPVFTPVTGAANPFNGIDVGRASNPSFIDWDGDGDFDLVSGAYDGTLLAWRNTGSATTPVFTSVSGGSNPFNGIDVGFYSAPTFVDWDGDRDLDLVVGDRFGKLQGWGNFGSATAPVFAQSGFGLPFQQGGFDVGDFSTAAFFDWEGDGDLDLSVADGQYGVFGYRNVGTSSAPTFIAVNRTDMPSGLPVINQRADVVFADWDGDGDLDFVSGEINGTILPYRNLTAPSPSNITVTVTAQNDAPVNTSGNAASFAENGTGTAFQATASDPDGNALTWSLGGADAALFAVSSAGAVTFRTAPNFEAPGDTGANNVYDLTVTASDGGLSSAAGAVAITVINVNEAPVFTSGLASIFAANSTAIAYQALASDPEGSALTWSLSGADAGRFTINGAGAVRFVTAPILAAPADVGGNNVYDIVVSAADTALNRTDRAVAITVALGNATIGFPTNTRSGEDFNASSGSVRISGSVSISDPDAGEAFFKPTVSAAPGTLGSLSIGGPEGTGFYTYSVSNAALQYLRESDELVETFTITSLDGTTGNISFSIDGIDDPSVISAPNHPGLWVDRTVNGQFLEVRGNLTNSDVDQGEGSFRNSFDSSFGFFSMNESGSYFYAVDNEQVKYLAFGETRVETRGVVTVGGTFATLSFTIHGPDAAPTITSLGTASFLENGNGTAYLATATDPEGVALTWSLSGTDAALFDFNATTREVTFKTASNFEAPADAGANNVYDVVVSASDGSQTVAKAVAITVTNVAEEPTLTGLQSAVGFVENSVNAAPQLLDADVQVVIDSGFAGGTLSVAGLLAEDRVSIAHVGNGAGQIGFADGVVSFGGTVIGMATGGGGADLTVTLNSAARSASVEALVEALAYANVSDNPTLTRSLTLNLADSSIPDRTFTALTGTANPFAGIDVGDFSTPTFVDLDGDGRRDLVVGEFNGTLLAWRNTATGFTALTGAANPFAGIDIGDRSAPTFVDLDSDGRLDLVVGGLAGPLQAWRNTVGGFIALTGVANPLDAIIVGVNNKPTFVDLDGDGRQDLVVGEAAGTLLAWRNTATGFTALTGAANPFNGFDVGDRATPAFVDLDGDGRLDLVSGEYAGALLAWRNTGSGFTPMTGAANPFSGFNVGNRSAPTFVDLDGDGRLDLVVGQGLGTLSAWRDGTAVGFSIAVTVTSENDAPSVTSGAATNFAENGTGIAYQATATDPDAGATLSWVLGGADAALFDVDITGAVTFKTAPDFEAPADGTADNVYDITVTASDGTLDSTLNAVAITVTDMAEGPSVTSGGAATFAENGTGAAYQASGSAPNPGATLSWTLGGADAARFAIDGATGVVTFAASPDFEAPTDLGSDNVYDITVTASDGTLSSAARAVAITVANLNEAPSVTSGGTASFAENGTGTAYAATGSDPDAGSVLAWSLSGTDAALFDLDTATGTLTFKTAPNFEAPADAGADNIYDIVLTVSDGTLSEARDVGVAVTDVNEAPVLVTPSLSIAEGVQAVGALAATDPDAAGSFRFSLSTGVADNDTFTIDALTGALRFVDPAGGDYETKGSYGLVVRVSDPVDAALFTESAVTITVLDVQDPGTPTAGPDLLIGTPEADTLSGLEGDDTLLGLADADTLLGGEGTDRLDGGLGGDSLIGGAGDDTYLVDDAADTVVEAAFGGFDRINSRVSFTLGAEVERLRFRGKDDLDGTGTDGSDRIDGNAGANRLDGGGGDDRLDGGLGADELTGGAGSDVFRFSSGQAQGDVVTDFAGNGAASGDRLQFRGFGTAAEGASFVQIGARTWQVNSADGAHHEVITFANDPVLRSSDWSFG